MPLTIPLPLALSRFKQLPQRTSEVWQGGLVRLPAWIEDPSDPNGAPARPTGAVWVSLRTGRVNLQLPPEGTAASPELALMALVDFAAKESKALKALGGRPARVEVRGPELKEALEAALAGTGTAVVTVDDLPAVKEVLRQFERAENPVPYPGLLDTPGMTVERVRAFAEAAAGFYDAGPWRHLTNEDLLEADVEFSSISVEPPKARKDMAYICVLGNGGQQFGLAFFESRRAFERLVDQLDPRKTRRAFGVTFGPPEDLSFADADLWEDHRLPVAGPRAYPLAADFRMDRILRPDTRTLTYMEALLRALADTREDELDSGRWQREVITFDGPVTLTMNLPYLLEAERRDGTSGRGALGPAIMPRLAERSSAQIGRFLAQREFASMDEVNSALQEARQQGLFDQPPEVVAGRSLTPLEQAQELAYDASEVTGRLRIKLARKALALSADCADAHVTLGEAASTPEEALDYYQRGVDAGVRALGQERLSEETGELWAHLEARPYLRARLAVAQALRDLGRIDEALAEYRELLRLNRNDNQGVRYLLLPALIEQNLDEEAGRLLEDYEHDIDASWHYGRSLWMFRRDGDGPAARAALQEAMRTNAHVVGYLLNPESIPWLADHFALGSKEEAAHAADALLDAFEQTTGALAWIRTRTGHLRSRRKKR